MKTRTLSLPKRLFALSLLLFLGFGLGAILLEAGVRVLFPVSDFFWEWDPAIGMKLIPGKRGRAIQRGIYDAPIEVNSVGFRDREHAIDKPAGTQRIVLLGDSFLEAIQVPFEESITPLLEKNLSTENTVELINLSVSGAGTARQYLALREYGLRYKPDAVLLFFVGNDVSDNSRKLKGVSYLPYPQTESDGTVVRDDQGRPTFTPFADQNSLLGSLTQPLKDHSKAYRFIREGIDNSPGFNKLLYRLRLVSTPPENVNAPAGDNFGFYEIYRSELKPAWSEAWRTTEEMILATRDLATSAGSRFAVVTIPAYWEVDSNRWNESLAQLPSMREASLDLELPSKRLSEFLKAHDIPVFNLLPDFRSRATNSPPLYLHYDAHWTAAGHSLAAELLKEPVRSLIR